MKDYSSTRKVFRPVLSREGDPQSGERRAIRSSASRIKGFLRRTELVLWHETRARPVNCSGTLLARWQTIFPACL
jgi:hypothetical protein